MRKLKKRLAALGVGLAVMAASVMSLSASAGTWLPWGPHYFTPDVGTFYAGKYLVCVDGMTWSSADLQLIAADQASLESGRYTAEYEFRPVDANGNKVYPRNVWARATTFDSNMPDADFEFQWYDFDDISIVCGRVADCVTNTTYYGRLYLEPKSTVATTKYNFESEYGLWSGLGSEILNDSDPVYFESYGDYAICDFNRSYTW